MRREVITVIQLLVLLGFTNCSENDKPTPPKPLPPVVEQAKTDTKTKVEKQTLYIENTNNGDTNTITVTDEAGKKVLDTTYTAKQFTHKLNNLTPSTYTTKTITKKGEATATDEDRNNITAETNDTSNKFEYTINTNAKDLDNNGHANDIVIDITGLKHPSGIKSITVTMDGEEIKPNAAGQYIKKDATPKKYQGEVVIIAKDGATRKAPISVEVKLGVPSVSIGTPEKHTNNGIKITVEEQNGATVKKVLLDGQAMTSIGNNQYAIENVAGGTKIVKVLFDNGKSKEKTIEVQGKVSTATNLRTENDGATLVFGTTLQGASKAKMTIVVKNEQGQEVHRGSSTPLATGFNGTININTYGKYTVEIYAETEGNTAVKTETKEIVAGKEAVSGSFEVRFNQSKLKEGTKAGEVLFTVEPSFTINGQTKTASQLQALGYKIDYTLQGITRVNRITMQGNKGVVNQELDRDGDNNTNPEDLRYAVYGALKATVTKNGKQVHQVNKIIKQELPDAQDYKTKFGHLVELKNGKNAPEYDKVLQEVNQLSSGFAPSTSSLVIDPIVAAGGGRLARDNVTDPDGITWSHITIDGKRLGIVSFSYLLDAAERAQLSNDPDLFTNTNLGQYLAQAILKIPTVSYSSSTSDIHAQIQFANKLDAAIAGAGALVNKNIDDGKYN